MPDLSRLQDIVTYDIVPELESYLHTISKSLHSSLDQREESVASRMPKNNAGISDDEEDKNAEDDDEQEERGRSKKKPNNKKAKAAQAVPEN